MSVIFPLQSNGYVDLPRSLFAWFLSEGQDMFYRYMDSPEARSDYTDTVTVLVPHCDIADRRVCYRKVTEERFDEMSFGYAMFSPPDKLDACCDAYIYLSETDPDWVTPDRFIVP